MPESNYRTTPVVTKALPPGIGFIIGNEAAERFSFYGMRAILVVFMTNYLLNADGTMALMHEDEAKGWFHLFVSAGYLTPLLGVLMLMATLIFRAGRRRFTHIPPGGMAFVRQSLSAEGLRAVGRLSIVYAFVAVFWALFDQTGSSWVLQANHMDRVVLGYAILPSQMQAANPLLVMVLIPLFSYLIYPAIDRLFALTELRKIAIGMFVAVLAFVIPTWLQMQIDAGLSPHIIWQLLAYVLLTSAEVMISITCLEFSYTQAPERMKSFVMAFFMLSIAAGNLFTSAVNFFIQNEDGSSKLAGADYFLFFTVLMLMTAILFAVLARFYTDERQLQG